MLLATTPVWSLLLEAAAGRAALTARGLGGTLLAVAVVGVLAAAGREARPEREARSSESPRPGSLRLDTI